jgi:hypothetical protein
MGAGSALAATMPTGARLRRCVTTHICSLMRIAVCDSGFDHCEGRLDNPSMHRIFADSAWEVIRLNLISNGIFEALKFLVAVVLWEGIRRSARWIRELAVQPAESVVPETIECPPPPTPTRAERAVYILRFSSRFLFGLSGFVFWCFGIADYFFQSGGPLWCHFAGWLLVCVLFLYLTLSFSDEPAWMERERDMKAYSPGTRKLVTVGAALFAIVFWGGLLVLFIYAVYFWHP